MQRGRDEIEALLQAVADSGGPALTPDEIARLAEALDADPRLAARLADVRPRLEPALAAALQQAEAGVTPSAAEWAGVWANIEQAAARGAARPVPRRVRSRILRLWQPALAAAACLVLAALWRFGALPGWADGGDMRLAHDVEINSIEVYGAATSFVVSTGGSDAIEVIWVLDEAG